MVDAKYFTKMDAAVLQTIKERGGKSTNAEVMSALSIDSGAWAGTISTLRANGLVSVERLGDTVAVTLVKNMDEDISTIIQFRGADKPNPRPEAGRRTQRQHTKKVATITQCLCGCGGMTKSKFVPGHDAKLKSILMKVERGELSESVIPEIVRPHLTNCRCCGQPMMSHESGMGPICRTGKCSCSKKKLAGGVAG